MSVFVFVCVYLEQENTHTQDTAPLLNTNLELQHVKAVVTDLNTECVDVRRLWPTTAPVLLVPSDIKCHACVVYFL